MTTKRKHWRCAASLAAAGLMALIGGCEATEKQDDPAEAEVRVNAAIVQMHFDEQARAGAIAGRTIYPYHFLPDQARLTPLGADHVQALALAMLEIDSPSIRVNVRRGDAPAELYDARIAALRERFAEAGAMPERIVFADGLSGGKGMSGKSLAAAERAGVSSGGRSRGEGSASISGGGSSSGGQPGGMSGQGTR